MLADNYILIGFMGSGKSSVGKKLAEKLGYDFKDTDEMIVESEGVEIDEIFLKYGEELFRNLESTLLLSIVGTLKTTVLSTGGGMPLRGQNVNLLRLMGRVIYLQASMETIIDRLSGDNTRPLLKGENPRDKVEKLLAERTPIYKRSADTIIDTDGKTIDDIVREILGGYNLR
ncbi:MAG: shikimate kinase [Clostridiales bacterium]|jgi:shikimate kinase|nr:shikimate kinase [Clostridiales bacterium]